MRTEHELREFRESLHTEPWDNSPAKLAGIHAARVTLSWVLDDDPNKDLARIHALVTERLDVIRADEWIKLAVVEKVGGVAYYPLDYIAAGRADALLVLIPHIPVDWRAA